MQGNSSKAAGSATSNAPPPTGSLGGSGDKKSKALMVADILSIAGEAFGKLSELVMDLTPEEEILRASTSTSGTRWSDQEVKRLHEAMSAFNNDLAKISYHVKTRTVAQVKAKMKKDSLVAAQNSADSAASASSSSNTGAAATATAPTATTAGAAASSTAAGRVSQVPLATTTAAAAATASSVFTTSAASNLHASLPSLSALLPGLAAGAGVAPSPAASSSTVGLGTVASVGLSTSAAMTTAAPPLSLEATTAAAAAPGAVSQSLPMATTLSASSTGLVPSGISLPSDISAASAGLTLPPIEHSLLSGILTSTVGGDVMRDVSMTSLLSDATSAMMSSSSDVGVSAPLDDTLGAIVGDGTLSSMVTAALTTPTQTAGLFSGVSAAAAPPAPAAMAEALSSAAMLAAANPLSGEIPVGDGGLILPAELMPAIGTTEEVAVSSSGVMRVSESSSEDSSSWLTAASVAGGLPPASAASIGAASTAPLVTAAPLADTGPAALAPAEAALEPPAKRALREDSSPTDAERAE